MKTPELIIHPNCGRFLKERLRFFFEQNREAKLLSTWRDLLAEDLFGHPQLSNNSYFEVRIEGDAVCVYDRSLKATVAQVVFRNVPATAR